MFAIAENFISMYFVSGRIGLFHIFLFLYHIFTVNGTIVNDFADASRDVVAVVDAAVVVAGYAATLRGRSMRIVRSG